LPDFNDSDSASAVTCVLDLNMLGLVAPFHDLLPQLQADPQRGRFWAHREEDSARREKQLPCESRHPISQTLPHQLAIRPPLRRRA